MATTIDKYPFIFSEEPRWKWRRHLALWLFWWIFQGILYSFIAINNPLEYPRRLASSLVESLVFLIAHIFLTYSLIYFVIPGFLLKQKYIQSIFWVVLCFMMAALLASIISLTLIPVIRDYFLIEKAAFLSRSKVYALFLGWLAGLRGAITIGGFAGAIKLMKYWYVKEARNLQLQQENTRAQLELLKAQVHPHFLFNTLNNIYSHAQQPAPVAANMILRLSDMLRYMLYETQYPQVPLEKEIDQLKNYMNLEKQRYGNHLDLQFRVKANANSWLIAPLLFLPLVENAFKHGASEVLDHPWISFDLHVDDAGNCSVKLLNGHSPQSKMNHIPGGIGLTNLKRRLEILYPGHSLEMVDEEDVFIINLSLNLQPLENAGIDIKPKAEPAYET